MIVPIPTQYQTQVTNAWNNYRYAISFYSESVQRTALSVLMVWLDKCSLALGQPKATKPYAFPGPPDHPTVVTVDPDDVWADSDGTLSYP